jgi:hypothetical protein
MVGVFASGRSSIDASNAFGDLGDRTAGIARGGQGVAEVMQPPRFGLGGRLDIGRCTRTGRCVSCGGEGHRGRGGRQVLARTFEMPDRAPEIPDGSCFPGGRRDVAGDVLKRRRQPRQLGGGSRGWWPGRPGVGGDRHLAPQGGARAVDPPWGQDHICALDDAQLGERRCNGGPGARPHTPAVLSIVAMVCADSLAGPSLAIRASCRATESVLPRRRTPVALSKPKLARILLSALRDTPRWRRQRDRCHGAEVPVAADGQHRRGRRRGCRDRRAVSRRKLLGSPARVSGGVGSMKLTADANPRDRVKHARKRPRRAEAGEANLSPRCRSQPVI